MDTTQRKSWRFRGSFEDVTVLYRHDLAPTEAPRVLRSTFARADLDDFLGDRAQHAVVLDLYGDLTCAPPYHLGPEHRPFIVARIYEAFERGMLVMVPDVAIDGDGARSVDRVEAPQKAPQRPPPKEIEDVVCKLVETEVECSHEFDDKPRKPSKAGVLEVVPAETGDKISLKGEWESGCGNHPEWTVSGFLTTTEKKAKTSFRAMPWFVGTPGGMVLRWLSAVSPKMYSVQAVGCEGSKQYTIKSYPSDTLTITLTADEWESVNEKITYFTEKVLGRFLKNPHFEILKGSASVSAQWVEWKDHTAYYKWDASIGFNPLIGAKIRIPFGPTAMIPQWMKDFSGSEAGFFVEFEGGINVNGHWSRATPDKAKMSADAEGYVSGKVGAELKLLSKKVLAIEVAGKSGFSIKAGPDFEADKPTLLMELSWEGIKGIVTVSACRGWIEIEHEFNLVDEHVIWEHPFELVKEGAKEHAA